MDRWTGEHVDRWIGGTGRQVERRTGGHAESRTGGLTNVLTDGQADRRSKLGDDVGRLVKVYLSKIVRISISIDWEICFSMNI